MAWTSLSSITIGSESYMMLVDELDLRLQPDALDLSPGQVLAQVGEPVDHHRVLAVERHQAGDDALGAAIVVERDLGFFELLLEFDQLLRLRNFSASRLAWLCISTPRSM